MRRGICLLMALCLLACLFAQSAAAYSDWKAEYDVVVSAPDGGVNLRDGPGVEYDRVLNYMIPNGVLLSVKREAAASNGNYWGYTCYDGVWGWIALTQVSGVTDDSGWAYTLYQGGTYADYNVAVSAPDGGVNLRYGPGTEYGVRISMIGNSEILHISAEAVSSSGTTWGYTCYYGTYGWVALSQVTQSPAAPAPQPEKPAEEIAVAAVEPVSQGADNSITIGYPLLLKIMIGVCAAVLATLIVVLVHRKK